MRISSISQAHHALVLNNNNVGGSSSSSSSSLMSRTTLLLPAFFFFMSRVAYGCPYDCGRGPGPGELSLWLKPFGKWKTLKKWR